MPLVSAREYKPIGDGDQGPNTGGMGAHSPGRKDADLTARVEGILEPQSDELVWTMAPSKSVTESLGTAIL